MGTVPRKPSTMRTSSGAPPLRSGMKSMTRAVPLSVLKSVSRISVPSRYRRDTSCTGSDGHISQWPCSSVPSSAAKHAAESVRGRHSQRSEEHTSELQSQSNLVCRLLLEQNKDYHTQYDLPEKINYAKMEKIARLIH